MLYFCKQLEHSIKYMKKKSLDTGQQEPQDYNIFKKVNKWFKPYI